MKRNIHFKLSDPFRIIVVLLILIMTFPALTAQEDQKFVRQGNREFKDQKFVESETKYRTALDKNKNNPDAVFNTGDALYRQQKYEEAGKLFIENSEMTSENSKKAASYYNLGNSLLMADKPAESIEAYKNSLKLNPDNMEAKYNLAYAQDLLRQQQQQQDQNSDKKDKQEQGDENDDQRKDDQGDQQKEEQGNQQKENSSQSISKEDAERVLNALANEEKKVQDKVKLAKAKESRVRTVKNW